LIKDSDPPILPAQIGATPQPSERWGKLPASDQEIQLR
jgi:hypothetical protein